MLRLSCEFCRAFGGFAGGRGQNRRRQPHHHTIPYYHTKLAAEQRSTPTVEARHTCYLDCMHVRYPSKRAYRLALPPPRGNTSLSDHGESTQATNLAAELAVGSQTSSYNFGRAQQGGKRGADAATVVWRECWYSRTSRVKPRSRSRFPCRLLVWVEYTAPLGRLRYRLNTWLLDFRGRSLSMLVDYRKSTADRSLCAQPQN